MTDKQSFLDRLNAALVERGVSDADIAPYIERFDRFYDRMVNDDASTSRALDNIDGIADNIAAQISERYDQINRLAENAMGAHGSLSAESPRSSEPSPVKTEEQPEAEARTEVEQTAPTVADDAAEYEPHAEMRLDSEEITIASSVKGGDAVHPVAASVPDVDDQPTAEADIAFIGEQIKEAPEDVVEEKVKRPIAIFGRKKNKAETEDEALNQLPEYVEELEEEREGDHKKFYIIFFATLPLTVILALAGFGLFAGVWAALACGIAVLMAALIGVSAAGAAVSLVGIVYGIIRLFDEVAVGLYEIGLGVLIAGITMLVGILMYNAAIRLFPFLIKKLFKLFKFVIAKLKELFYYLRRECSKL